MMRRTDEGVVRYAGDHHFETTGFPRRRGAGRTGKTEFDLLLTDLMMPEMNGIELLQTALKGHPNLVASS